MFANTARVTNVRVIKIPGYAVPQPPSSHDQSDLEIFTNPMRKSEVLGIPACIWTQASGIGASLIKILNIMKICDLFMSVILCICVSHLVPLCSINKGFYYMITNHIHRVISIKVTRLGQLQMEERKMQERISILH